MDHLPTAGSRRRWTWWRKQFRAGRDRCIEQVCVLGPHPCNRKQGVTDDREERGKAPYGEHALPVACRKASAVRNHIAERLPPTGKSARQPASRINDRKRDTRDYGQIEHENRTCNEKAEKSHHGSLQVYQACLPKRTSRDGRPRSHRSLCKTVAASASNRPARTSACSRPP